MGMQHGLNINPAFLGHGIWLELSPIDGLRRYASYKNPLPSDAPVSKLVDNFIVALSDMKISSVWFEIFTHSGIIDPNGSQGTQQLVDGLTAAKINVVPWAYCWGTNSENQNPKDNDIELAKRLCETYKLDCFVADIEPWNKTASGNVDKWNAKVLNKFVTDLNLHFGTANLGLSSFANLSTQDEARDLLVPLSSQFSFCAPQIYWNKREPIAWTKQSLQSWRDAGVTTQLSATVQSYWELDDGTGTQDEMTQKVIDFVNDYPNTEYSQIIGMNWYHAGGKNNDDEGGMSQDMIDAITKARLDQKPYKKD